MLNRIIVIRSRKYQRERAERSPSVHLSLCLSVCPSIRPFVSRSTRQIHTPRTRSIRKFVKLFLLPPAQYLECVKRDWRCSLLRFVTATGKCERLCRRRYGCDVPNAGGKAMNKLPRHKYEPAPDKCMYVQR